MTSQDFQDIVNAAMASGYEAPDLAQHLGVSISQIERWSSGQSVPLGDARAGVARRLNILIQDKRKANV